jgi:hypothetical protein
MASTRRNPDLIRRSRPDAEEDPDSKRTAEAASRQARAEAAVGASEAENALSWVARTIGTGSEAQTILVFALMFVIIFSSALALFIVDDKEVRSAVMDLFKITLPAGLAFIAGKSLGSRR